MPQAPAREPRATDIAKGRGRGPDLRVDACPPPDGRCDGAWQAAAPVGLWSRQPPQGAEPQGAGPTGSGSPHFDLRLQVSAHAYAVEPAPAQPRFPSEFSCPTCASALHCTNQRPSPGPAQPVPASLPLPPSVPPLLARRPCGWSVGSRSKGDAVAPLRLCLCFWLPAWGCPRRARYGGECEVGGWFTVRASAGGLAGRLAGSEGEGGTPGRAQASGLNLGSKTLLEMRVSASVTGARREGVLPQPSLDSIPEPSSTSTSASSEVGAPSSFCEWGPLLTSASNPFLFLACLVFQSWVGPGEAASRWKALGHVLQHCARGPGQGRWGPPPCLEVRTHASKSAAGQ